MANSINPALVSYIERLFDEDIERGIHLENISYSTLVPSGHFPSWTKIYSNHLSQQKEKINKSDEFSCSKITEFKIEDDQECRMFLFLPFFYVFILLKAQIFSSSFSK